MSKREKCWTPGPWAHIPWHVAEGDPEVRASKSHLICTTDTDQNARLIAAAPELVEALEAAYEIMEHMGDTLNGMDCVSKEDEEYAKPRFEKVRAALAKAKGETP